MPNPNTDLFAAMDLYKGNSEAVTLGIGKVISVGNLMAQVAIGGSNQGQPCSFDTESVLAPADIVLLVRPQSDSLWSVAAVIKRSRAGSPVISRPAPNNVPGMPRRVAVNMQSNSGDSWSGTTLTTLLTATANFTGGTPVLLLNGYAAPGASDVNLEIGWGEGFTNSIAYKATLKSTVPFTPINIFDVGTDPLIGAHTFSVRGQLSAGAITPTLTYTRFALLEI